MLRRRFLGAVAALAAAPVVKLEPEPEMLLGYPIAWVDDHVERTVVELGRYVNAVYAQPRFIRTITSLKDDDGTIFLLGEE